MCMNLYRHIDRTKVQFDFVKHLPDIGAYEEEIRILGGKIYTAPRYRIYNQREYCLWWRRHLENHPEHRIVHGHFITIAAVFLEVSKGFDRMTIAHSHSTNPRGSILQQAIKRSYIRGAETCSDYCIACSRDAGQWVFPHREFAVLNNAIDTEKFKYNPSIREEVRTDLGLGGSFTVGIVGSLSEVKNPFGTIEIFKAVHNKTPGAKLLWVGGGGMEEAIKQRLKEEQIADAVIMTGVRPDVDRLMQAMDVFILPSIFEGLPVVLVEAQAAGLTCFCSEAVTTEADITGLCRFLPLGQPDLWAEQILSADLTRKDTRQAICDAGYDIHTTAQWLQDFYLKLDAQA